MRRQHAAANRRSLRRLSRPARKASICDGSPEKSHSCSVIDTPRLTVLAVRFHCRAAATPAFVASTT